MMDAKYAIGAKERDGLAATYRRLWLTSSVLACAVLVVALIGAWGFSAATAYESAATLLYGTMTSEMPEPDVLRGGYATASEAVAAYTWPERGDFLPMSVGRDIATWDGLPGFHEAFVALHAPDDTVTVLQRPSRVTTGEDSDFTDEEAAELIERASDAFASGRARFWWERLITVGGRTFLWDSAVVCVNPDYDPKTGENADTAWYASGDLQDYVADGYLAGRMLGMFDVTPDVVSLTSLAKMLAALGAVGCALLVFVCRRMVRRALKPAEDAAERQRAFIVRASHELKTPLASLSATIDAMGANEDETVGSQRRWLDNMREEVDAMAARVCELLAGL